jgi:tetratricopeptide (TPR) repeat protein
MRTQLQTVLESAWHNLAVIHTRRGETDAAADAQRRAARWSGATESASTGTKDADKALGSAEQLIQAGDAAGAERAIQPLLEQRPDLPAALRVLGLIRAAQGRYDEAEALLRRAIERDPTEHAALLTLAEAYVARGEYQRATATLDRMPAALQTSASSVRLRAYLGAGRSAEARRLVSDVAALATADEAADVVEALLARDMVADAERLLDEVGNRRLSSARLLVASARLRVRAGDARGAESLLQRGLTLQPDSVEALRLLAQVASDRGDDARAADLLVTANEHAPDSPELLRQLAEASARAARLEEALAAARRLATLRPDDIDAKRLLAVTLLQNQNWREAIAILESPPPAAAGDARWTLALGMAEFGRRAYDAARAAFERALALDPDLVEARFHLGLIAREQGRTADAIGALSAVVARDPAHRAAHLEIGTLYLSTGDLGRARSHLECAAGLNPDDPAPHYQLALLARREGDTDRARGEMQLFQKKREKALADAPANVVKSPSRKGGC